MRVCLGLIVKNGGDRIYEYLDHHMKYFDECVIIDDNSTDNMAVEINAYIFNQKLANDKIKLIQHPLDFDFGAQRTFLNQQSTCDWIAHVDIDEFLPLQLLEDMSLLIDRAMAEGVGVVVLPRINIFDGVESNSGDKKCVFTRNSVTFFRKIHELPLTDLITSYYNYPLIHIKTWQEQQNSNKFYYDNFEEQRAVVDAVKNG